MTLFLHFLMRLHALLASNYAQKRTNRSIQDIAEDSNLKMRSLLINRHYLHILIIVLFLISACHAPEVPTYALKLADASPLKEFVMETSMVPSSENECNFESFNDSPLNTTPIASQSEAFKISGWLIDSTLKSVPSKAFIVLENDKNNRYWRSPLKINIPRADVVQTFGDTESLKYSGFNIWLDARELPTGKYHAAILYLSEGIVKKCNSSHFVVIEH